MELTSANVFDVLTFCLFKPEELTGSEIPLEAVIANGITLSVGLHPGRLKERFEDIKSMISYLPIEFTREKRGGKGGWSFLCLVQDKNGVQWGGQKEAQELLVLGLASNLIKYCAARYLWNSLPGGVPYIVIDLSEDWIGFETFGIEAEGIQVNNSSN